MSFGGETEHTNDRTRASEVSNESSIQTRKRDLDEDAIEHMLNEMLGGNQGLSAIFAGEQNAGIYNSTVAAEATGDLVTKILGELSALTAEEVVTSDTDTSTIFREDNQEIRNKVKAYSW